MLSQSELKAIDVFVKTLVEQNEWFQANKEALEKANIDHWIKKIAIEHCAKINLAIAEEAADRAADEYKKSEKKHWWSMGKKK